MKTNSEVMQVEKYTKKQKKQFVEVLKAARIHIESRKAVYICLAVMCTRDYSLYAPV